MIEIIDTCNHKLSRTGVIIDNRDAFGLLDRVFKIVNSKFENKIKFAYLDPPYVVNTGD